MADFFYSIRIGCVWVGQSSRDDTMKLPLSCATALCVATSVFAQEQPNTILVLDGSGSMWGQIDGTAKITIAQDVVSELLSTIPADQGLGLTVYGHRERGNCTDIETIVSPAPGTASAIQDAVAGIKPLGKTPMTDAVIAAAEALRYTEDKATVILVSDGVETCNPDPCAAARLLEEAGIDFTAHVVGFDVGSDPEALAQMQCIAGETGGQFLTADNAGQLAEALTQVAAAPEPEPEPVISQVTFEARLDTEDGPLIEGPLLWTLNPLPENVAAEEMGNGLLFDMEQGSYDVTAYWLAEEVEQSKQFIATADPRTVILVFETPALTATITAPATAPLGSTIEVGWNGPNGAGDYIGIGAADADGSRQWRNFAYTGEGNPVMLVVPPVEGPHLIQYFTGDGREAIGAAEIMVTPIDGSITAPAEAVAGSDIEIDWVGPNYQGDYIGIGRADADDSQRWENFIYTNEGRPNDLTVPATPGDYKITYFIGQDRTVLVETAISVVDVTANLTVPTEAVVGSTISVDWTGPNYQGDYIGIGKVGASGGQQWENFAYTNDGSPLDLVMPTEPGDYIVQYFVGQDRSSLTSTAITLTEVGASVVAPTEAVAGATIEVAWTGPNYPSDYIGIGKVGATSGEQWQNFEYTNVGNPLNLVMPTEPGDYLIQYFTAQDRSSITSVAITVTEVTATVTAPTEAVAGSTIEVAWTGPDYGNDYIGIGKVDASGGAQWETYEYTSAGDPLQLRVPTEPGAYLVQYFLAQSRAPLKGIPLTVTAVEARLIAEDTAAAGSDLVVAWDGPNYAGDYIGIGKVDATGGSQWQGYAYTSDGNPATVTLPDEPGAYVIQYFLSQDRKSIASIPLTIE